jgi:hypothetical protein
MSTSETSVDNCDPGQLAECMPTINGRSTPTTGCCSNLRTQQGCFCEYVQNPAFAKYLRGDIARHTLTACNIDIPNCLALIHAVSED